MGRKLTDAEEMEYRQRRAEDDKKIASGLGLTVEQLEDIRRRAKEKLVEEAKRDALTDEQFAQFVDQLCQKFKTDEYKAEFKRVAEERKKRYSADGNVVSLREELQLDADAMLRAEEYYTK